MAAAGSQICPGCGVCLVPQARFCPECGFRLNETPPPAHFLHQEAETGKRSFLIGCIGLLAAVLIYVLFAWATAPPALR